MPRARGMVRAYMARHRAPQPAIDVRPTRPACSKCRRPTVHDLLGVVIECFGTTTSLCSACAQALIAKAEKCDAEVLEILEGMWWLHSGGGDDS